MSYYFVEELSHYCNVAPDKCTPIAKRCISYYDFTFVLEGTLVYWKDGVKFTLQKNDAIFFKPGAVYYRETGKSPVHFVSFNFTAIGEVDFPFPEYMPRSITHHIRELVALYPPAHLSSFYHTREKCVCMLNYILYELLDSSALKCDNPHVLKMLHYIEEHIRENLTLQTISTYMNLSKEYTSYIFKREMGKTLTAYVNERKLLVAKEMILGGEMSLTEVAAYLGFENYNYFSRLFKKYLETTSMTLKQMGRG